MSKWLTTGEMIDKLKVGEIAKKENSDLHIKKATPVLHKFCTEDGDISGFREVTLDAIIVGHKWRIIPNYVSFDEAKKAAEKGEIVYCHYKGEVIKLSYTHRIHSFNHGAFSFDMLDEAKWTIEGDNQ